MPNVASCPDAQQWQQLLLGRLPEMEAESLEQHLAGCDACLQAVRAVPAGDTLVDALRAQGTASDKPVPEGVRKLVDRIKQLRPALGPSGGDTVDAPSAAAVSSTGDTLAQPSRPRPAAGAAAYDFLAPGQGPDELGRLGPYRILKVLGVGGMGVVFQAEDPRLKRLVALKVMKPALAASDTARKRFLREAQLTASIDHDHIVHIYEVGEDRGAPYLAMQLLKGETLEDRLGREGRLPAAEVLRIGRETAEGLAAAHSVGLIHRDVKPSNLWLEGERGRVKVLDFGLARAVVDDSNLTQPGAVAGTPAYMAPEQARGEPVDARCDLFSLGCVLYRACTGEVPFKGATSMAVLVALTQHQPPPPQALNPAAPPELSDLVTRLISKDAAGRPPSARAVVEAIAEIERDRTILLPPVAHPPRRKVRRRWPLVVAAAALGAALLLAAAVAVITLRTPNGTLTVTTSEPDVKIFVDGQEKVAIDSKKVGKVELVPGEHHLTVKRGDEELFSDDFSLKSGGETVVEAHWQPRQTAEGPKPAPAGQSPLDALRAEDIPAAERFDWQPKELVAVIGEHKWRHWGEVHDVAVNPDGSVVASAGVDGARVWESATARQKAFLPGYTCVAMTADGKSLACGQEDGTLTLWDVGAGEARSNFKRAAGIRSVAFAPDGKTLACSGADNSLWLLDAATGEQLAAFPNKEGYPTGLTFSPDGRLAAAVLSAAEKTTTIRVWDVKARKERFDLVSEAGDMWVHEPAFSPDGTTLAAPGLAVTLWDMTTGKARTKFPMPYSCDAMCVRYTPDGKTLIVGLRRADENPQGDDLLWLDAKTGEQRNAVSTGDGNTAAVAVSADGKVVVSAGRGAIRRWDAATAKPRDQPHGCLTAVFRTAFAPDGRTLAWTANDAESLILWDAATGRQRPFRRDGGGWFSQVAFSPDGKTIALSNQGEVEIRATATGEKDITIRNKETEENHGVVSGLAFTPDSRTLAAAYFGHTVKLWDPNTGEQKALLPLRDGIIYNVALSPDGKTLAAGLDLDRPRVELWDVPAGKQKTVWPDAPSGPMLYSADGKTLITSWGVKIEFRDMADGKLAHDINVSLFGGRLALSPDGRRLAVAGSYSGLVLLDAATGQELRRWKLPGAVGDVAFAPDGRHLAIGNSNGTAYILRLDPAP